MHTGTECRKNIFLIFFGHNSTISAILVPLLIADFWSTLYACDRVTRQHAHLSRGVVACRRCTVVACLFPFNVVFSVLPLQLFR